MSHLIRLIQEIRQNNYKDFKPLGQDNEAVFAR